MVKWLMQPSIRSDTGIILLVLPSTRMSLEMSSRSRAQDGASSTSEDVGHGSVCGGGGFKLKYLEAVASV